MTRTICLHGPESTGKTTLAPQLARRLSGAVIDEYGRTFAEKNGIDFTMADLVAIAQTHDRMTQAARTGGLDPLLLDTDPLMTAVWADMLFGERDPWFDSWTGTADLYLLLDIDLPWIEDGTRMFGTPAARRHFFDLSRAELERRGLRWALVGGAGDARLDNALRAIEEAGLA
ncbi:MAG: N-acetylglucosamine-6-phosphate isomerase [Sphingomonas bacterium]|nr:N-acetylglucosamine-6-phosphate isomerase [Sphingomonas bacterium]